MSNNPNGQRKYFPQTPSATSLLPPQSRPPPNAVQAAFARGPPSLRSVSSNASLHDTRYAAVGSRLAASTAPSISDKFSLSPDPSSWGAQISPNVPEPDDYLHNPDPRRDMKSDAGGHVFTWRGLTNLGCMLILGLGLVALFAGYPIIAHFTTRPLSTLGGFNFGGINGSGQARRVLFLDEAIFNDPSIQVPSMPGNWGLIDLDTPKELYTKKGYHDGAELQLVFSDEFNQEGRTFYPGDDPYWEAANYHYWSTNNMEWYDPEAVTTKGGSLQITLDRKETHGLHYEGGLIMSWNKFCFTGGLIESSVMLPGVNNVVGLWPALWTLGNLGRAGYGATLEGMWPYTYDSCDVGTVRNQTVNGKPEAATVGGDKGQKGILSFLQGQRLSRCTCPGESHPGPVHSDGTYVGRSAPEIDVFEAQVKGDPPVGEVSQSAQWGPFNARYEWFNTSDNVIFHDSTTHLNDYLGGVFQQATSGVAVTNQQCYELTGGCFSVYAFEYKPGFDDAYITWVTDNKRTWTIFAGGTAADTRVDIGPRPVPQEPMYIIINLGMSENFGHVDLEHLTFPTKMLVDWVRVYQRKDSINIGCDPKDFPTSAYINQYLEAYTNPNLTTWVDDYKQPIPKNRFLGEC
ncbi:hypothetical protein HGRIS_008107 [Hohenbuehelia grisea]|uniref:GH16 domain-containing protein n=1 Tax=Hohenbuehelia grisea TaxID=104357 RepID=A0ABR3J8D7_9AGAR